MEECSGEMSRSRSSGISVIKLRSAGDGGVADITGQVHHLPCCIKFNGHDPSVSHFFKPKPSGIENDGLTIDEAYFRGRKLLGARVSIPDGYSGFVLGKTTLSRKGAADASEENFKGWETKATFQNITFWNHDNLPSHDDIALRAFHWLPVANALHKPVTAEDMACHSTKV